MSTTGVSARVTGARRFDVAVVGAGPAGSVAAAVLARAGACVALIDRSSSIDPSFGECLPPDIRPILERAGVWKAFERAGHLPSAGIRSAWGSDVLADRDFLFTPYGSGWHIDRRRFDELLVRAALDAGAIHAAGRTLRTIERSATGGWRLALSGDAGVTSVHAAFVIDASGRAAAFARRAGVRRRRWDRLVGIGGHFSSPAGAATAHGGVLLVEAVRDGWWYSAPLPAGRLAAVYMTDADGRTRHDALTPEGWRARLRAAVHTHRRVEAYGGDLDGPLRFVAADSSRLEHVAGEAWLAAGDAAAAFDPLSSHGISAAVSTGLEAGRVARAWLAGDRRAIGAYAEEVARGYAAYLASRTAYYGLERRWRDAPFWRRRHDEPARRARHTEVLSTP